MKPLNEKIKAPKKAVRIESMAGVIKEDFITLGDCISEIGTVSATVEKVSEIDVQAYYIKCVCENKEKCVYLRKIGEQTRVFFAKKTSEGHLPFAPFALSEFSLNELLLGKDRRAQDMSLAVADRLVGENELKYISAFMPDEHPTKRKKALSMALSDDEEREYTAFYWKNGKSVPCADMQNIPELFEVLEKVTFNDIDLIISEPEQTQAQPEKIEEPEEILEIEEPQEQELPQKKPEETQSEEAEVIAEQPGEIAQESAGVEEEIAEEKPEEVSEKVPEKIAAPKKKEKPKKVGFFERRRKSKHSVKKKVGENEEDFERNKQAATEKKIEPQPEPEETPKTSEEPAEDEISAEESEALAAALSVDLLSEQELNEIFENPFEDEPEPEETEAAQAEEKITPPEEIEEIEQPAEVSEEPEEVSEKAEELEEEAEIIADEKQVIEEEAAELEDAKEEIKEEKREVIEAKALERPVAPKKKTKPKKVGFFERRRKKKKPVKKKVGAKDVYITKQKPEKPQPPKPAEQRSEVPEKPLETEPVFEQSEEKICTEPVITPEKAEITEEIPQTEPEEIEQPAEVSEELEEFSEKAEELEEEAEIIADEKQVIEEETAELEDAKEEIAEEKQAIIEAEELEETAESRPAEKAKEKKKKGSLFAKKPKKKKASKPSHTEKNSIEEIEESDSQEELLPEEEKLISENESSQKAEENNEESFSVEDFFESEKPLTLLQILDAAEITNQNKNAYLPYMRPALLNTVFVVPITDSGKNANEIYVSKKAADLLDGKNFEISKGKELVMPDDDRIDLRLGIKLKTIMSSGEAYIPAFTDFKMFEQIFGKLERGGLFAFPNLCKQIRKNEHIKGVIINPEITDLMLSEDEMTF